MRNLKQLPMALIFGIVTTSLMVGVIANPSVANATKINGKNLSESPAISVDAKSKITLSGLSMLDEFRQHGSIASPVVTPIELRESFNINGSVSPMSFSAPVQSQVTSWDAFIELTPEGSASMLEALGLEVRTDLGHIVIVDLPLDRAEEIANLPWVKFIEFSSVCQPQTDMARSVANVNSIHSGGVAVKGRSYSFDGSGVICGMVDKGFDPNHINFKNTEGESRIKHLWHYNTATDQIIEYTPESISTFVTDDSTSTHGTHVAGILAGGYKGKANYIWLPNPDNATGAKLYASNPMPYYGIASGADLAVALGSLSNSYISSSIDKILKVGEAEGKPVVISLSMSSFLGPHDGTDAFPKVLSALAKRGVICMSAGNNGDYPVTISKTFTETDNYILTGVSRYNGSYVYPNYCSGNIDIWANDNVPLTIKFGICDSEGNFSEWAANNPENPAYHVVYASGHADYPTYFGGGMGAYFKVEDYNNRFHCLTQYNSMSPKSALPKDSYFCIYISGKPGQTVDVYTTVENLFPPVTFKANIDGAERTVTAASGANSMNNFACVDNIISVGATVSRTFWATLEAKGSQSSYTLGDIAPFSSYGKTVTGLEIPTVVAPGAKIISSFSTPYVEYLKKSNPDKDVPKTMIGKMEESDRTNYWSHMEGTSCSTPFVAGTIALWLQADPSLTPSRIMEIIKNSSTSPQVSAASRATTYNRWGAGIINGESGLQSILADVAMTGQVWNDDDQRLIINRSENLLEVFVAGETSLKVSICDIQGRIVATAKANAGQVNIGTADLSSGVYIVRAEGANSTFTRKLAL